MGKSLSRQGGGIGTRGPGETKLESDRRHIRERIDRLRSELAQVRQVRSVQRERRMKNSVPVVAIVGYTNAGKSTVMNRMVEAYTGNEQKKVLEKDMLFATLETSVRTIETGDNKPFFLVDTVGFIHKLPHGLVKAFHSTLEEVKYADLLIQVVDFSDPQHRLQMDVTRETLKELGAGDIPMLIVYNKAEEKMEDLPRVRDKQIYMSAVNSVGIKELVELIKKQVYADNVDATFLFPYDKGNMVSYFMENATVLEQEYLENGVQLVVNCHKGDADKYSEYLL
jgi:GTP-binding protein HflX